MEAWLTIVITVVVFLIVVAVIGISVAFGTHAKAQDIPEPSAPGSNPITGVPIKQLPSFGFTISETLESNVYVPDETVDGGIKTAVLDSGDTLNLNHLPKREDRFGQVRVSKDGTTLMEITHRFANVTVNRTGEEEPRSAQNALIVYRRKDDRWIEYESNLASDKFQSFYQGQADNPIVGRGKYAMDVSSLGSFCAVQEQTDAGSDIVWLYRYDGGINNYRGPPVDNISTGRLNLEGEGGLNYGKVTKFLSDTRLLIATSSTDDNPSSGGVFLFQQNPELGVKVSADWFIQPTIGTQKERILRPRESTFEDPSFGNACAGDGNALVVAVTNPAYQRVHVYSRKDNRKLFDTADEQVLHFEDNDTTDIAVSDPPNWIALGQHDGEKVVLLRRENDNSPFKIQQTIHAPTLLSGSMGALGFGTTINLSSDARALVVTTKERITGLDASDPRHYAFAYARDPTSNMFVTANIEGGPQYLNSEAYAADFLSIRVNGTDAEMTRGNQETSTVVTYKLS